MKRLISCAFNMDTAGAGGRPRGVSPRHTGASVNGLRINVTQPTGQMIGVLCHFDIIFSYFV